MAIGSAGKAPANAVSHASADARATHIAAALEHPPEQAARIGRIHGGSPPCSLSQIHTHQRGALQQGEIGRQPRYRATRETDHQLTTTPGEAAEGRLEKLTPYRIEDHVDAEHRRQRAQA